MARTKRDLVRININVPAHVLQAIDEYAQGCGISRTTAILFLCAESLGSSQETNSPALYRAQGNKKND